MGKTLLQFFDAKISEQDFAFRAFVNLQAEESFRVRTVIDPVSGWHAVDPGFDDVAVGGDRDAIPVAFLAGGASLFVLLQPPQLWP